MTGRTALVLLTSTLHHQAIETPSLVVERQLALLRAVGHDRIVLLGGDVPNPARDVFSASSGPDAASLLANAESVTVLGHACITTETTLEQVLALGDVLATRCPSEGWERIDAEEHWAGVLRCSGTMIRSTFVDLSDWDAQATLLRRAVQAGVPRVPMDHTLLAQGFASADWHQLLESERAEKLGQGPWLLTRTPQAFADRAALWIDSHTSYASLIWLLATLLLAALVIGAALAGINLLAAGALVPLVLSSGGAVVAARLDGRPPWPPALVALFGLIAVPVIGALRDGSEWAAVATAANAGLAVMLLANSRRPAPPWLGLDTVAAALTVALIIFDGTATLLMVTPVLLLTVLSGRDARRRISALWTRWQD